MRKVFAIFCLLAASVTAIQAQDAYINVSPSSLPSVTAYVGETATFKTVHISQGNLVGPTYFYLSGYNANMFSISASELGADESEIDLVITYTPTKTGTHTAILNIDNWYHTGLFQSISLKGVCQEPDLHPSVSVTPTELPDFNAVAGKEVTQTVTVSSSECKDYVYLRVDHTEGVGFTIDNSMLAKNTTSEVTIRFAPTEAGTYRSTLTVYTQDAQSVVVNLNGTATPAEDEVPDWATSFAWGKYNALTVLNETFDNVPHNETLVLDGWQNVAKADARPWWGHRDGYAKATAYQHGKASTGDWTMWLVTPPLDYGKTRIKMFGFKVMGEYLLPDSVATWFEVYYVDPNSPVGVYFQDLTDVFTLPMIDEDDNQWFWCVLDLTNNAETIADVFHIAFRYVGPNGAEGAVTYYVDDVTWGIDCTPSGIEPVAGGAQARKILRNGQVVIVRGQKEYDVTGRRVK